MLLNAIAVESREIASHEMHKVAEQIFDIHIATYCKPELVDKSAGLLRAITYTDEYVLQYFHEEDNARNWLMERELASLETILGNFPVMDQDGLPFFLFRIRHNGHGCCATFIIISFTREHRK